MKALVYLIVLGAVGFGAWYLFPKAAQRAEQRRLPPPPDMPIDYDEAAEALRAALEEPPEGDPRRADWIQKQIDDITEKRDEQQRKIEAASEWLIQWENQWNILQREDRPNWQKKDDMLELEQMKRQVVDTLKRYQADVKRLDERAHELETMKAKALEGL